MSMTARFRGIIAEDARGFFAIRRHEDVVATAFKGQRGNFANGLHGLWQAIRSDRRAPPLHGSLWWRQQGILPAAPRKEQRNVLPLPNSLHVEYGRRAALMMPEDRCQSERSFSRLFRCEEWFENTVSRGSVHAGASVGDNELDVVSGSQPRKRRDAIPPLTSVLPVSMESRPPSGAWRRGR